MNLRGFSWREGYLWGKVVGYAGAGSESPITPPDFNDGPLDTDAVDRADEVFVGNGRCRLLKLPQVSGEAPRRG